jgi:hypothetical protein
MYAAFRFAAGSVSLAGDAALASPAGRRLQAGNVERRRGEDSRGDLEAVEIGPGDSGEYFKPFLDAVHGGFLLVVVPAG